MLAPHLARNTAVGSHGSSFQACRHLKEPNRHDSYSSGSYSSISLPESRITPPASRGRPYLSTIREKEVMSRKDREKNHGESNQIDDRRRTGDYRTYFRRPSRSSASRPPYGDTSITCSNDIPFISYLGNVKPFTHCYSLYLIVP
jgi:hypothetical protein